MLRRRWKMWNSRAITGGTAQSFGMSESDVVGRVQTRGHVLGFSVKSTIPVSRVKVAVLAFGNLSLSHLVPHKYVPVGFPPVMGSSPNPSFHGFGLQPIMTHIFMACSPSNKFL